MRDHGGGSLIHSIPRSAQLPSLPELRHFSLLNWPYELPHLAPDAVDRGVWPRRLIFEVENRSLLKTIACKTNAYLGMGF